MAVNCSNDFNIEMYRNGTKLSGTSVTVTAGDTLRVVLLAGSSFTYDTTDDYFYMSKFTPGTNSLAVLYSSTSETGTSDRVSRDLGVFLFNSSTSDVSFGDSYYVSGTQYYGSVTISTTKDQEVTYKLPKTLPHNFKYTVYFNPPYLSASGYDSNTQTTTTKSLHYSFMLGVNNGVSSVVISNPWTVDSSNASIHTPRLCSAGGDTIRMKSSFADTAVVNRSLDNGATWSEVYKITGQLTATSFSANSMTCYYLQGSGVNHTFTDPDASTFTGTVLYKVEVKNTISKVKASSYSLQQTTDILQFNLPSNIALTKQEDVFRESPGNIVVTKSTADLSRITFKHYFARSLMPSAVIQGVSGTTTYPIYNADDKGSIEGNLDCSMFQLLNGNHGYRIEPVLDGTGIYQSAAGNVYEEFYYTRSFNKLEMIRPIEMGQTFPEKISILTNPPKTRFPDGSNVKFYVANNGNDENIIWEELPTTCVGSISNPDVDSFMFSTTEKTAATWKIMVKIVADRGTSEDFKLNSFSVVINGGKEETVVPYTYVGTVILDANATAVQLDMPSGFNKVKIVGHIINADVTGNPYITVNGMTSGYTTTTGYNYSTTTKSTTSTTNAGSLLNGSVGTCPQFEMDLYNYGTTWYNRVLSIASKGRSHSHSVFTLADGLMYITLTCNSATYPMLPGTEFTIIGVR